MEYSLMSEETRETDSYLKKASKGATIVLFGLIISSFLGYLTRLVIVRFYGIEDYGLFSLGVAIVGIAVIISMLGMQESITRFVSFHLGRKSPERAKSTVFSGIKITVPISMAAAIVVYLLSHQISLGFFNEPALYPILWAFAVMIPLSVILTNIISTLRGLNRMKYKVYAEDILKSLSTIIFVAAFFFIGLGIMGIIYSYIIGFLFAIVLASLYLHRSFPALLSEVRKVPLDKELLYFSWPLLLAAYTKMIISWTDIIALGFFKTSYDVGLYNVALPTAGLMLIFLNACRYIFIPVVSELFGKDDKENMKTIFNSINKWVYYITFPAFLLMILFPDNILMILFGSEAVGASMPFIILSVGFFIFSAFSLTNTFLFVIGRTKTTMFITLIGAIANIILNILLIPIFGINGAALSTSLSFIIISILSTLYCYKHSGLLPVQRVFTKPMISGIVSVLAFYIFLKFIILNFSWPVLIISFPPFLLLYTYLLFKMKGLDKNDLMILKTVESKTGLKSEFLRRLIRRFL
jgi:O-antigen/teichoic acid export membrane protein